MKAGSLFIFDRSTLLHLRLPFSFFLLPIFVFGISQAAEDINWVNTLIVFVSLHFFIYPGSNVYNSYMDKDSGSIGGLRHPPPVTEKLFYASILFDGIGLLLCLLINPVMLFMMIVFVGVSKAYSWKKIRLKKYGFTGWLVVMLFQGGYTFLLVNMVARNNFSFDWFTNKNIQSMLIASLLIGGYYPLTQIYQHDEDSSRGDYTISYKLGINGTFIFTGTLFIAACAVAWNYFNVFYSNRHFAIFILSLLPVIVYYFHWFVRTYRDKSLADYSHSMRITLISSCCMLICFTILALLNLHGINS
jgi:1,4-dihydroxy-2-naphthoate polyprenyltransferase